MRLLGYLVVPLMTASAVSVGIALASTAAADCVTSNGTMLCSQGDVRGSDTGQGPGSGPSVPYPCNLDWYCDEDYGWELGIILDPGNETGGGIGGARPPRPNNDLPGRPNRPGGGGRR